MKKLLLGLLVAGASSSAFATYETERIHFKFHNDSRSSVELSHVQDIKGWDNKGDLDIKGPWLIPPNGGDLDWEISDDHVERIRHGEIFNLRFTLKDNNNRPYYKYVSFELSRINHSGKSNETAPELDVGLILPNKVNSCLSVDPIVRNAICSGYARETTKDHVISIDIGSNTMRVKVNGNDDRVFSLDKLYDNKLQQASLFTSLPNAIVGNLNDHPNNNLYYRNTSWTDEKGTHTQKNITRKGGVTFTGEVLSAKLETSIRPSIGYPNANCGQEHNELPLQIDQKPIWEKKTQKSLQSPTQDLIDYDGPKEVLAKDAKTSFRSAMKTFPASIYYDPIERTSDSDIKSYNINDFIDLPNVIITNLHGDNEGFVALENVNMQPLGGSVDVVNPIPATWDNQSPTTGTMPSPSFNQSLSTTTSSSTTVGKEIGGEFGFEYSWVVSGVGPKINAKLVGKFSTNTTQATSSSITSTYTVNPVSITVPPHCTATAVLHIEKQQYRAVNGDGYFPLSAEVEYKEAFKATLPSKSIANNLATAKSNSNDMPKPSIFQTLRAFW